MSHWRIVFNLALLLLLLIFGSGIVVVIQLNVRVSPSTGIELICNIPESSDSISLFKAILGFSFVEKGNKAMIYVF